MSAVPSTSSDQNLGLATPIASVATDPFAGITNLVGTVLNSNSVVVATNNATAIPSAVNSASQTIAASSASLNSSLIMIGGAIVLVLLLHGHKGG
jgi:hypothetical protein